MRNANTSADRRSFIKMLGIGASGVALIPGRALAGSGSRSRRPMSVALGISTYSYWHFAPERTTIRYVIEEASRLGVPGVDVLHRQMQSEDADYIRALKRHALAHGVALNCLSTHQDFVHPEREHRQQSVEETRRFIRLAHEMGIPCIRVSAGRWRTIPSFADFMAAGGVEPPIAGYTEDDGFDWVIESLEPCVELASELGVVLALENHWGMTRTAEGILRILKAIDSPWLGVLMDTGNFLDRMYEQMEMIAPYTVFVQAKTYQGGGRFYTLDIDYDRVAGILRDVGYRGYVSIEFEGHAPAEEAVPESIEILTDAFSTSPVVRPSH